MKSTTKTTKKRKRRRRKRKGTKSSKSTKKRKTSKKKVAAKVSLASIVKDREKDAKMVDREDSPVIMTQELENLLN